jgi:hypothetical protein
MMTLPFGLRGSLLSVRVQVRATARAAGANLEPRTPNPAGRFEPEHEPSSKNGEE